MSEPLRAPFPWFGGKSRAADAVWSRFGDVPNYVEGFAGSLAVLLARPHDPKVETVNDLDAYLANVWRAIKAAPMLVAQHADQPVNEADLHAVHRWLVFGDEHSGEMRRHVVAALEQLLAGNTEAAATALQAALAEDRPLGPAFRERMRRDADYFDAEIAGRWIWGLCAWIGSGWCSTDPDEHAANDGKRPELGAGGEGQGRPRYGKGIHAAKMRCERDAGARPDMSASGRGVHAPAQREISKALPQKRPILGAGHGTQGNYPYHGQGVHSLGQRTALYDTFDKLAQRLRYVRVACGDWSRVVTDSVTWRHGTTGILLDPPYSDDVRTKGLYAVDSGDVAAEVLRWCREHGADERLRIALCGYDNEAHGDALKALGWEVFAWEAKGGYGGQRKRAKNGEAKNTNAARERIWFSPHCLRATQTTQLGLFR